MYPNVGRPVNVVTMDDTIPSAGLRLTGEGGDAPDRLSARLRTLIAVLADQADAAGDDAEHACLVERIEVLLGEVARAAGRAVTHRPIAKVGDDRCGIDGQAAEHGHAVPAPLTVVDQLEAAHPEGEEWRIVVGELGLLHQQHVGLATLEPLHDAIHARLQRVDIPGCYAHAAIMSVHTPLCRGGRCEPD